jgi:hypothetical protein
MEEAVTKIIDTAQLADRVAHFMYTGAYHPRVFRAGSIRYCLVRVLGLAPWQLYRDVVKTWPGTSSWSVVKLQFVQVECRGNRKTLPN